jgi:hypothetical protein
MRIIAFGYKKQRGKDTCCNFMKDWLTLNHPELRVRKVGFADKLKDIAYQLYSWAGLQPSHYYETHYHEKEIILPKLGLTPRQIWIGLGNGMREIYDLTWVHYLTKGGLNADVLLIKDCGFTNEAIAVRESGGLLYKIERSNQPMANDPRETELDLWNDWDGIIDNHGTLHDLNTLIEAHASRIFS